MSQKWKEMQETQSLKAKITEHRDAIFSDIVELADSGVGYNYREALEDFHGEILELITEQENETTFTIT